MLDVALFSEARTKFKAYCDDAVDNNKVLIVKQKNDKNVVLQSLINYNLIINENSELKNRNSELEKELYIQKRMILAKKEIAEGKVRPARDVIEDLYTIVGGRRV